jgi:hypothetical protein
VKGKRSYYETWEKDRERTDNLWKQLSTQDTIEEKTVRSQPASRRDTVTQLRRGAGGSNYLIRGWPVTITVGDNPMLVCKNIDRGLKTSSIIS